MILNWVNPIETVYKGYRFRSRLEARWAVFFDEAKIRYEYEPEGFEDGNGRRYLPDFYLPDENIYVEVKPNRENDQRELMRAIRIMTSARKLLLILREIPYDEECQTWWYPIFYKHPISKWIESAHITFETSGIYGKDEDHLRLGDYRVGLEIRSFIDPNMQGTFLGRYAENLFNPINHMRIFPDNHILRDLTDTEFLRKCYAKARQARFEYGEEG